MEPVSFWHEHIGQHISGDPEGAVKVRVPTRLKRGVELHNLGAGIDAFYIVCEGQSYLVGKVELPSKEGLIIVPSEDVSGERFIAQWLANDAPTDRPWMVGVIGKACPIKSFTLSQPPSLCVFGQSGKNFEFNLSHFRADVELAKTIDWKILVQAIHAHDDFKSLNEFRRGKGSTALQRLFKRESMLKEILPRLRSKPNSGEQILLSWYNRAR